ncbi:uncharacterized protein LOC142566166 isoform X1 [Dermacentor variabilis]|uniref:uncharacterized protein LOC142566166 isoform X1 n=1 Tax=Dermacentor variabilis TaxID=34621 RepID=UPI003F5BA9F1
MGRVTKFPTSRCPTGTQGQATSLPLMSSLSRTNTISDLLKRRKKRRSRILTRDVGTLCGLDHNVQGGRPDAVRLRGEGVAARKEEGVQRMGVAASGPAAGSPPGH